MTPVPTTFALNDFRFNLNFRVKSFSESPSKPTGTYFWMLKTDFTAGNEQYKKPTHICVGHNHKHKIQLNKQALH